MLPTLLLSLTGGEEGEEGNGGGGGSGEGESDESDVEDDGDGDGDSDAFGRRRQSVQPQIPPHHHHHHVRKHHHHHHHDAAASDDDDAATITTIGTAATYDEEEDGGNGGAGTWAVIGFLSSYISRARAVQKRTGALPLAAMSPRGLNGSGGGGGHLALIRAAAARAARWPRDRPPAFSSSALCPCSSMAPSSLHAEHQPSLDDVEEAVAERRQELFALFRAAASAEPPSSSTTTQTSTTSFGTWLESTRGPRAAASEAAAALSATVCAGRVLPPRVQFALPPEKGAERRSTAMRPSDEKEEDEEEESRELLSASRGP